MSTQSDGRHLIVVTGAPGSGKSSFAHAVREKFPSFQIYPYDEVKEEFFDKEGFDSLAERDEVNRKSIAAYWDRLGKRMETGANLLIEYPFAKRHEKTLQDLIASRGYKAMTFFLTGDPRVLWNRWKEREQTAVHRHPGHLYTRYHKGQEPRPEDRIPLMPLDVFTATGEKKDYAIRIGPLVRVDVTDFTKVDWEEICGAITDFLGK